MARRLLKHSFSLMNVDHVRLGIRWNYRNVVSPYYRLYYIDDGHGTMSSSDETLELEEGYAYIIPSFTLCNLHCEHYLSQYFIQFFEDSANGISLFENNRTIRKIKADESMIANFKRLLSINPGRGINRSDNPRVYEKDSYYKEYQEFSNQQSLPAFFETQGIILQLLARFLTPETYIQSNIRSIPSVVMDAISFIQLHLHEDLTVKKLAARANLNEDYFSRLFKQFTGLRPIKHIHDKRAERAQYLITTTDLSYQQIAIETGFENLPYFSKVFKSMTGMTPGKYRVQSRALISSP